MVSGRGSNLQALIDAIDKAEVEASIALVLSSDAEAFALKRARDAGIPAQAFPYRRDPGLDKAASRAAYDKALADTVAPYKPDYIFLLGWMRLLGMAFLGRFPGKVVNLHPALPGAFAGVRAIERAWEACARGDITETGVMVHFVPDEGVDSGPVIVSRRVDIEKNGSFEDFEAKMHATEHALVVRAAASLAEALLAAPPAAAEPRAATPPAAAQKARAKGD